MKVRIRRKPGIGHPVPQNDVLGQEVYQKGGNLMYPFQDNPFSGMRAPEHDVSTMSNLKKGGHWLQGAVNPEHKGFCSPVTKATCTPRRKAFAMTMKKHHGFHKKQEGGELYDQNLIGNITNSSYMKKGGPSPDLNPTTNHSIADYNPYVYFKDKHWYMTSNPTQWGITDSMKPVDEDVANIEAEKGEMLVKPDLMGLYKITGKTHKQGGTPLYAEGGSFIFSNDPTLSLSKKEKEAFGLKMGMSNAKSKNTPAKVLGREVNSGDYNQYIANLSEKTADSIAKDTAILMLGKMQDKIGQVAYLQEAKKGKQAPGFAMGSAPVQRPEFQDIDQKMAEYKYGGRYNNGGYNWMGAYGDYNNLDPHFQAGGNFPGTYPNSLTPQGRKTPTSLSSLFNHAPELGSYPGGLIGWSGNDDDADPGGPMGLLPDWQGVGIDARSFGKQSDFQGAMYDWGLKNNPNLLRNMWSTFGINNKGKKLGFGNLDMGNLSDDQLNKLRPAYMDNMLGARVFAPIPGNNNPTPGLPGVEKNLGTPNVTAPNLPLNQPQIPGANPIPTLPYDVKGKLTPNQIADLSLRGLQAMSIKKYYPKREQVSLPTVRLDTINAQPYVNNINNQSYAASQLSSLNPRTASTLNSNIYGRAADQINQVLGNVANQNVQIGNQQNLTNLQQLTNQTMYNNQADERYYNEVNQTNQSYDNEKRFANNQFTSTLNNYNTQNDQLAWSLASQYKYGNRKVVDPKTGQVYNKPTPLYEITNNGIRFNSDVANLNMASNANRLNTPQELLQAYQQFIQSGVDPKIAGLIMNSLLRGRNAGSVYATNPYGPAQ